MPGELCWYQTLIIILLLVITTLERSDQGMAGACLSPHVDSSSLGMEVWVS